MEIAIITEFNAKAIDALLNAFRKDKVVVFSDDCANEDAIRAEYEKMHVEYGDKLTLYEGDVKANLTAYLFDDKQPARFATFTVFTGMDAFERLRGRLGSAKNDDYVQIITEFNPFLAFKSIYEAKTVVFSERTRPLDSKIENADMWDAVVFANKTSGADVALVEGTSQNSLVRYVLDHPNDAHRFRLNHHFSDELVNVVSRDKRVTVYA